MSFRRRLFTLILVRLSSFYVPVFYTVTGPTLCQDNTIQIENRNDGIIFAHLKSDIKVCPACPNPIYRIVVHPRVASVPLIPTNMETLQSTLHKPHTDLPRYPWKVSKVNQEASLHRGRADGWSRRGERRAPLAAGRAGFSWRPNQETECRGSNCRWAWSHWK